MTDYPPNPSNDADKHIDESWSIRPGEAFWLVLRRRDKQVLSWFRSEKTAMCFAKCEATVHGYTEYVVLEAVHSVKQASVPVPEVDVLSFREVNNDRPTD